MADAVDLRDAERAAGLRAAVALTVVRLRADTTRLAVARFATGFAVRTALVVRTAFTVRFAETVRFAGAAFTALTALTAFFATAFTAFFTVFITRVAEAWGRATALRRFEAVFVAVLATGAFAFVTFVTLDILVTLLAAGLRVFAIPAFADFATRVDFANAASSLIELPSIISLNRLLSWCTCVMQRYYLC